MSRIGKWRDIQERGFPRMSGDEPATNDSAITTILFSPHERG